MALDTAYYLVTDDIAKRSGLYGKRYVINDGRHVLNNKELARVRLSSDEFINGLQGVTKIDEETANTLIAKNGYKMASLFNVVAQEENNDESEGTLEGNE